MKYLNAIYLTTLLLVMLSGCGMSDQEAIAQLNQIQSGANNADVKIETKNLCQGETDKKHMFGGNLEFAKNVQECVKVDLAALSAYLDTGLMKNKYPEMTDGCLDCFAQLTRCAANNCGLGTCKGYFGADLAATPQCELCNAEKCHKAMLECSGVGTNDIPSLRQK